VRRQNAYACVHGTIHQNAATLAAWHTTRMAAFRVRPRRSMPSPRRAITRSAYWAFRATFRNAGVARQADEGGRRDAADRPSVARVSHRLMGPLRGAVHMHEREPEGEKHPLDQPEVDR
jgi:hypothetical protein